MKQFTKEIGAPDAIEFDASGEQTSLEVKHFCQNIGTSLQILEEGTSRAKKAELYIGLLKEAIGKDMKEVYVPLVFWD